MPCLFCELSKDASSFLYQNDSFYVIPDKYPASKGHCLLIAKQHIESFFDLNEEQLNGAFNAIQETKKILDEKYRPDAYNIGINEGAAAGRTIAHFHVHLIPRYAASPVHGGIEALLKSKQ